MRLYHRLALSITLFAITSPIQAQTADLGKQIRETMQGFVDRHEIAGAVTLVGDADRVLSLEVVGKRDLETGAAMTADTEFWIASMTKPITGMAIMMLVDEGKLSVNDVVEKHLPYFSGQKLIAERSGDKITLKTPARPITVRDLLTHTSGLPDSPPPGSPTLDSKTNPTLADSVKAFSKRPLSFEPGTKWAYSNAGMATLGRIIEVIAGKSYDGFLNERFFAPLGMNDTSFFPNDEQWSRMAMSYEMKEGKLVFVSNSKARPVAGIRYPSPAGGLYSTAPDLAKLYQMILHKGAIGGRRLLSENALAEMARLQTGEIKTGFTENMGYGLGFGFVRKPTGVTEALSPGSFGHGGAWGTQAWIDPAKQRYVVLLIQRTGLPNSDNSPMRRAFQKAALH